MKKLFYLSLFMVLTAFSPHKYYVSVTELYLNKNNIQVIIRMFPDDIENSLKDFYGLQFDLMSIQARPLVRTYIDEHFQMKINDLPVYFRLEGITQEDGFFIVLLQADKPKQINMLCVTNSVLTEMFDEQKNIVHVLSDQQKKSFILTKHEKRFCWRPAELK